MYSSSRKCIASTETSRQAGTSAQQQQQQYQPNYNDIMVKKKAGKGIISKKLGVGDGGGGG